MNDQGHSLRGSWIPFSAVLLMGLVVRLGYVAAQPAVDTSFALPSMDAGTYVAWAQALASGQVAVEGAYYNAPLYPYLLAGFLLVFGDDFRALYLAQHLASLATGLLLGLVARRTAGSLAGVLATALYVFHATFLFFASRALGETVGLLLLAASLWAASFCPAPRVVSGFLAGAAALARPNLLLVPILWALREGWRRRWAAAALLLAGTAIAILPVTLRNFRASGHFVPIAANQGITAYHGNGPGALGTFKLPEAFTGSLADQRREATLLARLLSGRPLDPVEADRFWGREAWRARVARPGESLALLGRRVLLLLDNHEHGLDEHPSLDANPWRLKLSLPWSIGEGPMRRQAEIAFVPFGLILGLAAAGLVLGRFEGSGGWRVWTAIAACAFAPVAFYVSSRYRLPLAALLVVPAGAGAAGLLGKGRAPWPRQATAAAVAVALFTLSLVVPSEDVQRTARISAFYNRAGAFKALGDLERAERDARHALALGPESATAWYNLATIVEAAGRDREAEAAYLHALELDPRFSLAAANVASLYIRVGTPEKAPPILRRVLASGAGHESCWINLVIALWESGDHDGARQAVREGQRAGVLFDPEMLSLMGMAAQSATAPTPSG